MPPRKQNSQKQAAEPKKNTPKVSSEAPAALVTSPAKGSPVPEGEAPAQTLLPVASTPAAVEPAAPVLSEPPAIPTETIPSDSLEPAAPEPVEAPPVKEPVITFKEKDPQMRDDVVSQIMSGGDMGIAQIFQMMMPPGANGSIIQAGGAVAPVMVPVTPQDAKRLEAAQRAKERAAASYIPDPNDPVFAGYRKGDEFEATRDWSWQENGIGREIKNGSPIKYNNTARYIIKHAPAGTLKLIRRGPEPVAVVETSHAPVEPVSAPVQIPPELLAQFESWQRQQEAQKAQQQAFVQQTLQQVHAAPPQAAAYPVTAVSTPVQQPAPELLPLPQVPLDPTLTVPQTVTATITEAAPVPIAAPGVLHEQLTPEQLASLPEDHIFYFAQHGTLPPIGWTPDQE